MLELFTHLGFWLSSVSFSSQMDYTAVAGVTARRFFNFLETKKNKFAYFNAGRKLSYQNSEFVFNQNTLYQKECSQEGYNCYFIAKDTSKQWRYIPGWQYVPQIVGTGGNSVVYALDEKTFKLTPTGFIPSEHPVARVLKIQRHCPCSTTQRCGAHNPTAYLSREYFLTARAGHLNIQPPTVDEINHISYTVMDKLYEQDLFAVLEADFSGVKRLSLWQRMELSLALLEAVKMQVTDCGIIHHDLKSENIRITLGPPVKVGVIDYGLGLEIDPDLNGVMSKIYNNGTLAYLPLEVLHNKGTKIPYLKTAKIDAFSVGRLLVEIWGGGDGSYWDATPERHENYLSHLVNNDHLVNLKFLFRSIPQEDSLSLARLGLQEVLRNLCKDLLNNDPMQRKSINEGLVDFQVIYDKFIKVFQPQNQGLKQVPGLAANAGFFAPRRATEVSSDIRLSMQEVALYAGGNENLGCIIA